MSRDSMRELKTKRDEEVRLGQVKQIVSDIYSRAIDFAKTSAETVFTYSTEDRGHKEITLKNMDDILASLQSLFRDCSVEHKVLTMARGIDGGMRDITTMDSDAVKFVAETTTKHCIIIDWS